MKPELSIIKLFLQKQYFNQYSNSIDTDYIKKNNPQLYTIFTVIQLYHQQFPDKGLDSVADLEIYFHTQYPALSNKERDTYESLFQALDELKVNPDLVEGLIKAFRERQEGHRIALLGLDIAEGRKTLGEAQASFKELSETPSGIVLASPFISHSLKDVFQKRGKPGLRFRLKALNNMLGSLRAGDFGFVMARPEIGKTTFLASEVTYMAEQIGVDDPPILWFNNEQEGHVVVSYCYRAALGLTSQQLFANLEGNEKKYEELIGNRIRIHDSASIHKKDVESYLQRYGASLILFDQIDKIKGFDSDRNDLELGAIYQWARELSKTYAPVIGICQAGESGANKRWLNMEDAANAKTAKQAEADWILGVGALNQEGYEKVRHLHLSKNKLEPDVPAMRHGKVDVLIHAEVARYGDIK